MTTTKRGEKQPGFEKALERLETIVRTMENGDLSLDQMMKDFEEGMALVKLCSAKLNEVERKIEILVKKNGENVAEPFETPSDDSAQKPDSTRK